MLCLSLLPWYVLLPSSKKDISDLINSALWELASPDQEQTAVITSLKQKELHSSLQKLYAWIGAAWKKNTPKFDMYRPVTLVCTPERLQVRQQENGARS